MQKKTMDIILVILGISVFIFTVTMIYLYLTTGGIPDTLCTCFFAMCTGECSVMGFIKTVKEKYRDRTWMLEDEERHQKQFTRMSQNEIK